MTIIEKISILEIKSKIIKKNINKLEIIINWKIAPYFIPSLFGLFISVYFFISSEHYNTLKSINDLTYFSDFFKIYFQSVFLFFGVSFIFALCSRFFINKNQTITRLKKSVKEKTEYRDKVISDRASLIENFKETDFLDINADNANNTALIDELLDVYEKETYDENTLEILQTALRKTERKFDGKDRETEAIKELVKTFNTELKNDKSKNRQKRLEKIQNKNHNEMINIMIEND